MPCGAKRPTCARRSMKRKLFVKKRISILLAGICVAGLSLTDRAHAATTLSVASFGATGNGTTDDTAAIQAAINAVEKNGGGTVTVPVGTYLLNTYYPSPHPWFFYNLRVGSNVTIQATNGAKFQQGPKGRAPLPSGASQVGTSVIVFGSANFICNTFQGATYNGGFYNLKPTVANSTTVTLNPASNYTKFKAGDYVAIYSSLAQDVNPSESTQVASVSSKGVLTLKQPLARSFSGTPQIANVTKLATVNVGVNNLIIQGTEPLFVNETFNFTASNNTFISDTSVGGGNVYGLIMNDCRFVTFTNNVITSVGPNYIGLELPQRNSQNVTYKGNTFNVLNVGFGEYGAHWVLSGNSFMVHPDSTTQAGVFFGGLDVQFTNNVVNGSTSSVPLIADYIGVDAYASYVGQIQILNNNITCNSAALADCMDISAPDTHVNNNTIKATGSTQNGILIQGPLSQNRIQIQQNAITVQNGGIALTINDSGPDNMNISCNKISGSGLMGIYLASANSAPAAGSDTVVGNIVSGFNQNINVDYTMHPTTVVNPSTTSCPAGY